MKKHTSGPRCTCCGRPMVRVNHASINHLLAAVPDRQWRYLMASPDLLMLVNVAIQSNDARALRDVLGLLSVCAPTQSVAA